MDDAPPTTAWQPPDTAPENGAEFWYWARGRVRTGSLGHDLGGSIKRDPDMTAWHPKRYDHTTPPPPPPEHLSGAKP
jgi:hypothetical protein